jgi:transposase
VQPIVLPQMSGPLIEEADEPCSCQAARLAGRHEPRSGGRLHRRCGRTAQPVELPANISIVAIPSKSPELNPQENVWKFMRDNWLSNRVFGSYDEIVDHRCDAWNKLVEQPWRIMSLGLRDWAREF